MMPFHRRTVTASILALGLALAACSGDDEGTGVDDGGDVVEIHLRGVTFVPANVTIDPGTTVRWINDENVGHTVTPRNTAQTGVWSRRVTSTAGVVFEHTFNASGQTYDYFCEPHEEAGMTGRIVVR